MDFYKRVELVCKGIPCGMVATYGQIALLCQKPQNARQVGYALHKKEAGGAWAHRVVNGRGVLSGAAAFGEDGEQKKRLMAEGVDFLEATTNEERVNMKKHRWNTTMEDALWFVEQFKKLGI
jgi:methylated-DNA-protein-cysteine methyltransferase-like protein